MERKWQNVFTLYMGYISFTGKRGRNVMFLEECNVSFLVGGVLSELGEVGSPVQSNLIEF